jgi:hypothetical protein
MEAFYDGHEAITVTDVSREGINAQRVVTSSMTAHKTRFFLLSLFAEQ